MAEDVGGDVEDVLGQHVRAAPHEGQRPAGGDEAERGPGAGAVGDERGEVGQAVLGRRPGGQHEPHGVVEDAVVDEHRVGRLLQRLRAPGSKTRSAVGGSTPMRRTISTSSQPVG